MCVCVFLCVCGGVQLISSPLHKRGLLSDCKSPTLPLFLSLSLRPLPARPPEPEGIIITTMAFSFSSLSLLPLFSPSLIHTQTHYCLSKPHLPPLPLCFKIQSKPRSQAVFRSLSLSATFPSTLKTLYLSSFGFGDPGFAAASHSDSDSKLHHQVFLLMPCLL